jgi:DNA-binding transcriptional LysR family regulator
MDSLGSLNAFVQAEARSFTIARRQLGVSSSAIGKAVARIEERLGMRIFPLRSTANLTDSVHYVYLVFDGGSFQEIGEWNYADLALRDCA